MYLFPESIKDHFKHWLLAPYAFSPSLAELLNLLCSFNFTYAINNTKGKPEHRPILTTQHGFKGIDLSCGSVWKVRKEGFLQNSSLAFLSSDGSFTIFKHNDFILRFRAPDSLEKYVDVKKWDHGYIVVTAKYRHNNEIEEEYIDLQPILEDLYIDADSFLEKIKDVKIQYD